MAPPPQKPPRPASKTENPGSVALDQWRGLALVLVLVAHALHESHYVDGLGRVGVNLFFFISGILVFRSISHGSQTPVWQAISRFWHRRLRRLYPALLAYVATIMVAHYWLQRLPGPPSTWDFNYCLRCVPAVLLYLGNYSPSIFTPSIPPPLGHLWSLACEMQFYLIAPLFFFLGGKTTLQRNIVFGALLFILLFLGAGEPFLVAKPFSSVKYHFEFAVWPMMLGFWCEFKKDTITRISIRWLKIAFWVFLTLGLACFAIMLAGSSMKGPTVAAGGFLLIPCLLAYLMGWPILSKPGTVLRWLGERTYSIYLWQQPFTICYYLPVVWWPAGAALSVLIGGLWFHWFERPFLSDNRKKHAA